MKMLELRFQFHCLSVAQGVSELKYTYFLRELES